MLFACGRTSIVRSNVDNLVADLTNLKCFEIGGCRTKKYLSFRLPRIYIFSPSNIENEHNSSYQHIFEKYESLSRLWVIQGLGRFQLIQCINCKSFDLG